MKLYTASNDAVGVSTIWRGEKLWPTVPLAGALAFVGLFVYLVIKWA